MSLLKEYAENIQERTLFIFCSDCHCKNELIPNPDFLVATALGSNVTNESFGESYFDYCFGEEGIRQVVLVGHYQCQVLDFIKMNELDNPLWSAARKDLLYLEDHFKTFPMDPMEKREKIIQHYIAHQMLNLSRKPFFKALTKANDVVFNGIIINENKGNEVLEVRKSMAVPFIFN